MNRYSLWLIVSILSASVCWGAPSVPSGYMPIAKLSEAQAKAKKDKKLLAVVAKGYDDNCPYCVDAFSKIGSAIRSDCVMVFVRVKDLREQRDNMPAALSSASSGVVDGAAVTFYVFDPDISELVVTIDRREYEKNQKNLNELKKKVREAQQKLSKA